MAKIKKRFRRNGEPSFTVEVRVCITQSTKTFHNRKDAHNWAVSTEAALREGRYGGISPTGKKKVSDAIERFRQCPPPNAGDWLTGKSRDHFLNFWKDHIGRVKLADLHPSHIVQGRDKPLKKRRSPATCNRYVAAISKVLQSCIKPNMTPLGKEKQLHVNSFIRKPKITVSVKKYYGPLQKN